MKVRVNAAKWWCPGIPAPKGSARAITVGKGKNARAVLVPSSSDANRRAQDAWAGAVGWSGRAQFGSAPPMDGAVAVRVVFHMPAPKRLARLRPTVKPDLDKLLRSTLDALTGIAWRDDAQIVSAEVVKEYAGKAGPGADIEVIELPATPGEEQP